MGVGNSWGGGRTGKRNAMGVRALGIREEK